MRTRVAIGIALLSSLAACGGGGGGSVPDAAVVTVDSSPPPDSVGPHVCLTPADFGTPTLANQVAPGVGADPTMPEAISFDGDLNADATPDVFQLELLKGYGVFTDNVTTGTFVIAGDELNYATCGLCPRIFTDKDPVSGSHATQQYYATGGSITITSIDPDLAGTFTNLDFVEVTISSDGTYRSTPVTDGCATTISSGTFDAAVTY